MTEQEPMHERQVGGEVIGDQPRGVLLQMGSQSEEALSRLFSDLGVDMVSMPGDTPATELEAFDVVVSSGGANSVHDADIPQIDKNIFNVGFRWFGTCSQ